MNEDFSKILASHIPLSYLTALKRSEVELVLEPDDILFDPHQIFILTVNTSRIRTRHPRLIDSSARVIITVGESFTFLARHLEIHCLLRTYSTCNPLLEVDRVLHIERDLVRSKSWLKNKSGISYLLFEVDLLRSKSPLAVSMKRVIDTLKKILEPIYLLYLLHEYMMTSSKTDRHIDNYHSQIFYI